MGFLRLHPLHIACNHGCLEITQYLIQSQNCNPKTGTPSSHTPLHCACENGQFEVAKFLITEPDQNMEMLMVLLLCI